jgi:hypothetical protein
MANFLYEDLTQRLPRVLEPRYQTLYFENGTLIPTMTDLEPGNRELAYDQIGEYGDAGITGDAATNIPIVDITLAENRYPIYMVASGFPITFQEERAYGASHYHAPTLDRFQRRMSVARKAIAQRVNRLTAYGVSTLDRFTGFLTSPEVPLDNNSFNIYTAPYDQALDFFVGIIESLTDNFVSMEPTELLMPKDPYKRMMSLQNGAGSDVLKTAIEDMYPELTITKIQELEADRIDGSGITRPSTGKDRIMLYPKDPSVVHRHLEQNIAELVPESFIRTDGLRKIYTLFSCITPAIFDYPQDLRYIDIVKKP